MCSPQVPLNKIEIFNKSVRIAQMLERLWIRSQFNLYNIIEERFRLAHLLKRLCNRSLILETFVGCLLNCRRHSMIEWFNIVKWNKKKLIMGGTLERFSIAK